MRIPSTGKLCQRCIQNGCFECVKNSCIHGSKLKSFLAYVEAMLYKKLKAYGYIDCVICPSYFMQEQLLHRKEFQGKTKVLHNFISVETDRGRSFSDDKEYVLYFGRYSEEKGIRTLLKVCQQLPHIPFVFAGGGPLESRVNKAKNIDNVGFQEGEALVELIQKAKFSIMPSECYENCPFSVMESLALGTPVIGSRIGGIPELIEEGKMGDLFCVGNEAELKSKIESLWSDGKRLHSYSEACHDYKFDKVESYCKKLIKMMQV